MKKTISNFELENYIRTLNTPESFRNNINIKIPASLMFAVRVNLKAMLDRYSVVSEMQEELRESFKKEGKVTDTEIKKEYVDEWVSAWNSIMTQTSEVEISPVKKEDFENRDDLSWPELDVLFWMTEE